MGNKPTNERFELIELLRFGLALGVVVYHYYFWAPHAGIISSVPVDGLGLGYLLFGVETFFAVSGFVIVLSTAGRTPIEFFVARMARLGPTLLVASSLTLSVYYLLGTTPRLHGALAEYVHSVTLLPLARRSGELDWSLWSLSFEIRFYLLIFVCMFLFDVRRHAFKIGAAFVACDALRLVFSLLSSGPMPTILNLFGDYAPFFATGIFLYNRHATKRAGLPWIVAMAATLVLSSIRATHELTRVNVSTLHLQPVHYWQGLAVAGAILLTMTACVQELHSPRLARLSRAAGRASYPLYVVHQLCGYWILNFTVRKLGTAFDPRPVVLVSVVALALFFGNRIEPGMIAAYRKRLGAATELLQALWRLALSRTQPESLEN
jgi:peptidoglycan/LPS O-acetylase OafA/YrhL